MTPSPRPWSSPLDVALDIPLDIPLDVCPCPCPAARRPRDGARRHLQGQDGQAQRHVDAVSHLAAQHHLFQPHGPRAPSGGSVAPRRQGDEVRVAVIRRSGWRSSEGQSGDRQKVRVAIVRRSGWRRVYLADAAPSTQSNTPALRSSPGAASPPTLSTSIQVLSLNLSWVSPQLASASASASASALASLPSLRDMGIPLLLLS